MSGLWKTKLTMLTLAALLAGSHTSFAKDSTYPAPKDFSDATRTFEKAELVKMFEGDSNGEISLVGKTGFFKRNVKKKPIYLSDMGFYLGEDGQIKRRVGTTKNELTDPVYYELTFNINGEPVALAPISQIHERTITTTERGGSGGTRVGPAVSHTTETYIMSDADIRAMLMRNGITDPAALDRLVELFHNYLRNPNQANLDKLNAELKRLGFNPNASRDLIISIQNGGGNGNGGAGRGNGQWVWSENGSGQGNGNGNGGGSVDFYNQGGNGAPMSYVDSVYAKYGLKRPTSVQFRSTTTDSGNGGGYRYVPGQGGGNGNQVSVAVMSPDAIRQMLIDAGITDEATINKLIDLITRYQNGETNLLPQIDAEFKRLGLDPTRTRQIMISINRGRNPSNQGGGQGRYTYNPGQGSGDFTRSSSSVSSSGSIPAPTIESILGIPHLMVYEYDQAGNLNPVFYEIKDNNRAVDSSGKTIWAKNANGEWELVDASKKSEQAASHATGAILKKFEYLNGFKIKTMFIENMGNGITRPLDLNIPIDENTGKNVDHFLKNDPQTDYLRAVPQN